ncbi:unnamed protein product [Heterobilharzia americana]|nr:unnamed protein product [Heterobilharzia americana]
MADEPEEKLHISHPPAVKAGGMRIVTHARERENEEAHEPEISTQAGEINHNYGVVPHDLIAKDELKFHDKGIKFRQDKPTPKVTKSHDDGCSHRVIQQPLK